MKFNIAVTEEHTYEYEIEADSQQEAFDKAEELWHKGVGHINEPEVSYGSTWEL